MKRLIYLLADCLLVVLMYGCAQVETGRFVKCKHCEKVMTDTVKTQWVPFWEKDNYSVHRAEDYCTKCGNEKVQYTTSYRCKHCGSVYKTETNYALRKEGIADKTAANKYCDECGDEMVQSKIHVHCERCGEEYTINQTSYKRKMEVEKDKHITSGFCSTSCKVMKGTEDAGEQAGRWFKALGDGLMKGMEKK